MEMHLLQGVRGEEYQQQADTTCNCERTEIVQRCHCLLNQLRLSRKKTLLSSLIGILTLYTPWWAQSDVMQHHNFGRARCRLESSRRSYRKGLLYEPVHLGKTA